jgi:hypothetical protein
MSPYVAALLLAAVLPLVPASAQPFPANPRGEMVRVHVNVHFFVPSSLSDDEESAKARERARRMVYEMAGRECEILKQVIAEDCKLETLNVNVNVRQGVPQQPEGFLVNGSAAYRIMRK